LTAPQRKAGLRAAVAGRGGYRSRRIACFTFPAVLSHGKLTSGIPSVTDGERHPVEAMARSLFVEDRARIDR